MMLSFFNNKKNLLTFIFFLTLFFLGYTIYDDYGISIDEDNTIINCFFSLKYLYDFFDINYNQFLESFPYISEWEEKGIGFIFDLPTAFIEYQFQITDNRKYYLIRHFTNFLFFFIGTYYFFLLIKLRYRSTFVALTGTFLLLISPRIFAESFYNNKDLIFLSLFIISTFYGIKFIEKPSFKSSFLFALTAALSIGIRVLGIVLPFIICLILIIKFLRTGEDKKPIYKSFVFFLISFPIFTILFYPYLWDNPLENFILIFTRLGDFPMGTFNFYFGSYVSSENVPWHYSIVWIFITTPILYLLLFLIGFYLISSRIIKRLLKIEKNDSLIDLWRGNKELQDFIYLLILLVPIFSVIILNSTLYDGWRHLYFVYPSFLMISLRTINFIEIKYFTKKRYMPCIIVLFLSLPTLMWMIKNHPYQYVYFNNIVKKNFDKKFTMDYWGLSNVEAINFILKENEGTIKIGKLSDTDIKLAKEFLPNNLRKRVQITEIKNSDFLINNFIFWEGTDKKRLGLIKNKFSVYHEIKVDGISINTIYKKN